jgi:RNA recognition motif-containing protein
MTECETLYVSNLNDKTKAADLQALLYELFAGHGEVVAVQLLKARPARGTAFVTMRTTAQATSAMKNLNNFPFLGKPANVQYAKKQSDELAKLNGTYKPRFKPKRLVH